jgi:4-amino-4-deoxy-L-arabinose transferase-like glycosyltransferase
MLPAVMRSLFSRPELWVIFLWSLFIIIETFYTPIFRGYDSMAIYLPMAESIKTTGSLVFNPYYQSIHQMGYPPLFPVLYAFTMNSLSLSFIKLVPVIYFIFLMILIFKVGSEFLSNRSALLLVFIFLIMPSTQKYFGGNSLYIDLAFAFYSLASFYLLARVIKRPENKWLWFLLGTSTALLFMSKEFGCFLFFVVLSVVIFNVLNLLKNKYLNSVMAGFLAFFPYLYLCFSDIFNGLNDVYYYLRICLFYLLF